MNLKSKIWNSNLKNLLLINSRTFWDGDNWPNYNWKNDLKSRGKKKKDLEHSARSQKRVRVDWWLRELAQIWRFYFDHQSYLKSIRKSLFFKSFGPGGRNGQAGCGILFILCHALGASGWAGIVDSPWLKNDEDLNTPKYIGQKLIVATLLATGFWVTGSQADSSAGTRLLAGAPSAIW